jgi:RimJ/RimL family protein N-acetyltransferase
MMLTTARLRLREPGATDAEALCAYHARNAARFAPWEPPLPTDVPGQSAWIAEQCAQRPLGGAATFLAFANDGAELVGIVGLSGFGTSPASAMVHYTVDGPYEGRGYASEAVRAVLDHAFGALALDEVSAYYHPGNARSGRLLERLGFRIVSVTPVVAGFEHLMKPQAWAMLTRAQHAAAS